MAKIRAADLFIIISSIICFILIVVMFLEIFPELNNGIESISSSLTQFGEDNGLWAAFLLSMFGNTSVLIIFPYAVIVISLGTTFGQIGAMWFMPLALGILSGFGAAVGEITSYLIGRGLGKSNRVVSEEQQKKFDKMRSVFEEHPKSVPFIIYVFALTPLPDDVILVPFGMMKYSYKRTILPCMLGKMTLSTGLAFLGYFIGLYGDLPILKEISQILGSGGHPATDIIFLWIMFGVVWLMLRADMSKLIDRKKNTKIKTSPSQDINEVKGNNGDSTNNNTHETDSVP